MRDYAWVSEGKTSQWYGAYGVRARVRIETIKGRKRIRLVTDHDGRGCPL